MGRKIRLTETQLINTIKKIVREEESHDERWRRKESERRKETAYTRSPYDLEGHYIIGFDNRYDDEGEYELYWGDIGSGDKRVSTEEFQEHLNTWLDPEPERFCTLEEFTNAYPSIRQKLWRDYEDWMGRKYIEHFGCILLWGSKYGK